MPRRQVHDRGGQNQKEPRCQRGSRTLNMKEMASQEGFEPPTTRLEGECSIQLSYWDMMERVKGILNILHRTSMRMMLTRIFDRRLRVALSDGRTLIGISPFMRRAFKEDGAGEGNRTLASSLGSWRSAIELHPHACVIDALFWSKGYNSTGMGKNQCRPCSIFLFRAQPCYTRLRRIAAHRSARSATGSTRRCFL